MISDAMALFREVADRSPAERDEYYIQAIVDASSKPIVPAVSTLRFASRRLTLAAAAVGLASAVAAVVWLWRGPRAGPIEQGRPSVAVRPFESLPPDPAQSYFAAGITEEIRGQLSQVSSLRLLSRTWPDGFKDVDAGTIVGALGVAHFVDGGVRVDGTRVRITAELIDATTDETLWSNQYDRFADMTRHGATTPCSTSTRSWRPSVTSRASGRFSSGCARTSPRSAPGRANAACWSSTRCAGLDLVLGKPCRRRSDG